MSKAELAEHRAWLSEWRMPADMSAYLSKVNSAMGPAHFFGQGGGAFLRDAWLAAEFGRHRQSSSVQLVAEAEQWPDFRVRTGGVIEGVKCVEADIPGRRRGDEYREAARESITGEFTVEDDPEEDWIARAVQVPAALSAAIAKKTGKLYAGQASLLVNLNIYEFGIRQTEIEAAMESAIVPALLWFQHAWILWKSRLYGPWAR